MQAEGAADRRFYQEQAAADRRKFQEQFDQVQNGVLGLIDRQSRLEGVVDTILLDRFGIDRSG